VSGRDEHGGYDQKKPNGDKQRRVRKMRSGERDTDKGFQCEQNEEPGQHRIAPPFLPTPISLDRIYVAHVFS